MNILFICGGLGYGHVSRCISLAEQLNKIDEKIKIAFAFANVNKQILDKYGYRIYRIHDLNEQQILERVNNAPSGTKGPKAIFGLICDDEFIEKCVGDELEVIEKVQPDIVVYDGRWTGNISGKIKGVHTVSLIQNYLLQQPDIMKEVIPNEQIYAVLIEALEEFKNKINYYREQHNIKTVNDIFEIFTSDENYAATIKEFGKISERNKDIISFAGAFIKSDVGIEEDWVKQLDNKKKTIYVSTGGNKNSKQIVKFALDAIKNMEDVQAIVSIGFDEFDYDLSSLDSRIIVRNHVNTINALNKADLLVTHGGHTTLMEALTYGVPTLVIPFQPEQIFNGTVLKKNGVGDLIPIEKANYSILKEKIEQLLEDDSYKTNISRFKNINEDYLGPKGIAEILYEEIKSKNKVMQEV